jgi:hypothetical protein
MTSAASVPYAVQGASHGAELFRRAVASALHPGVAALDNARGGVVNSGDLAVTAGTGNTLNVAAGQAWIPGTQGADQGLYYALASAAVTGMAVTPNASNPLVVLVTASVNDVAYTGNPGVTSNEWDLLITQGTAAASPAIPATPDNSLVLATVLVPTNASAASSYTIQAGLSTISGTTLTSNGQGVFKVSTPYKARMYRNAAWTMQTTATAVPFDTVIYDLFGSLTTGASAVYTCPVAGYYFVTAGVGAVAAASTDAIIVEIIQNSTAYTITNGSVNGTSVGMRSPISDIIPCAAGDTLSIKAYCGGTGTRTGLLTSSTFMTVHLLSSN